MLREPLDQVQLALSHAFHDAHRLLEGQLELLALGGLSDQAGDHDQFVHAPVSSAAKNGAAAARLRKEIRS
jgi:hypothetical protein